MILTNRNKRGLEKCGLGSVFRAFFVGKMSKMSKFRLEKCHSLARCYEKEYNDPRCLRIFVNGCRNCGKHSSLSVGIYYDSVIDIDYVR